MQKRLILLFLLLFPIVNLFHSCVCDVTTKYESYTHKTLLLKNLDNSGAKAVETNASQINKNAYGIRVYLTSEINSVASSKQNHFNFIQSVHAMTVYCPPEYIFSPSDSIVSMKIITVNDFDDLHSENSDITHYFRIANSYSTIDKYVANMTFTYESDIEFEASPIRKIEIDLLLMTAPAKTQNHQFKIQITLSDGRILEEQTSEIELL